MKPFHQDTYSDIGGRYALAVALGYIVLAAIVASIALTIPA